MSTKTIFNFLFLGLTILISNSISAQNLYDIKHYDLFIKPDFINKTIELKAIITIDNPTLQDTFSFGLNDNYDSVAVKSFSSQLTMERNSGWVAVIAKNPAKEMKLTFELRGNLKKSNSENHSVIADSSLFLLWCDRFYPMDSYDWATVKTTIILPSVFKCIAPGKTTSIRKFSDVTEYVFETTNPTVCFSVFADSRWIQTEREINGIKMQTLLYPKSQKFAEQIFTTSSEILKFYSETYCFYSFDQFSFITISDIYARRAFPGFIGYEPGYLEKEFKSVGFDAHETALLWWFYTLRGNGQGAFQWTEGFGDYAEILYDEKYHKPIPEIFKYFKNKYLELPVEKDLLYYELKGGTPQEIIHGKYPWLMQLLHHAVGDSAFQKAMKLVFNKFQFQTFSMDTLISTLEEGCGQSLQWWKTEWLERKGVPILSVKFEIKEKDNMYEITVFIEQSGNLYHLPIEIGIETDRGILIKKINLEEKQSRFSFESAEKPKNILIDPNEWILKKNEKH